MNNNEILEMNKKEKLLDEKLEFVKGTVEQYKKQLQEYKESHPDEFKDANTPITDIHAIGSLEALRIEIENRDALQEEKDKINEIREQEKKKVQEKLDYVQETIKQYKKQLQEYKESHPEEFEDKNTPITDIHAIGSLEALRIEMEKEKELQETMKLLNFDEEVKIINEQGNKIENTALEQQKEHDKEDEILDDNKLKQKKATEEPKKNVADNKEKNNTEGVTKTPKTAIVNPILAGSNSTEIDENKKDEEVEFIDLDEVEKISSESIRIIYDAKTDKYLVRNLNMGKDAIVERKKLQKIDKNELAEKLGKEVEELKNIDTNILQILQEYDEKYNTSKADEYINMMTEIGKSKKDRQQEMKKNQIDIEYNLKGLYDTELSKEDREELLSITNNANKKGIATVKKGFITTAKELWERIISFGSGKIKQLAETRKKIALPESKREKKARQNRAKAREERLQESENELVELEEIIEESERVEQEIEKNEGTTYTEKLANFGEKFRDTYKVSENQDKNRKYFRQSKKIREDIKKRDYKVPYKWNNGNYTPVKDEENSL